MSHLPLPETATSRLSGLGVFAALTGLAFALPGYGQMSPEEHAKHHPGPGMGEKGGGAPGTAADERQEGGMPGTADGARGKGMMGGMDMGAMMDAMAKAPAKESYPTLMGLPDLTPEQREDIRDRAEGRMRSGATLLSEGLDRLGRAAEDEDYAAMQDAAEQVREALARFESGLAARRALAEGTPPRQVALHWFKGEMNLQTPQGVATRGGLFGATPFHLFACVLLIAFALAVVAMHFFKMRRAVALFGRIESESGRPPPGSAPPLAVPPASGAGPAPPAARPTADAVPP